MAERPGLRVALAQQRLDELIEQTGLTFGGDAPAAQMSGIDAGVEEAFGVDGDLERILVVHRSARRAIPAPAPRTTRDRPVGRSVIPLIEHSSRASSSTPGSSVGAAGAAARPVTARWRGSNSDGRRVGFGGAVPACARRRCARTAPPRP